MTAALAPPMTPASPPWTNATDFDAGLRQLAAGPFGLPHLRDGQLTGMRCEAGIAAACVERIPRKPWTVEPSFCAPALSGHDLSLRLPLGPWGQPRSRDLRCPG